jgi:hypothetical protein
LYIVIQCALCYTGAARVPEDRAEGRVCRANPDTSRADPQSTSKCIILRNVVRQNRSKG